MEKKKKGGPCSSFPHELQKQHREHHCGFLSKEKDDAAKITAPQFIAVLQGPQWPPHQELQDQHI